MWTRRAFRRHAGTAGAAALAILKPDGIARAAAAPSRVADRSLDSVARDETYWGQIQQAFTSTDDHQLERYRIIVTPITHAEYEGFRVTPNVYTTLEDIDTFAGALEAVIRKGLPTPAQ